MADHTATRPPIAHLAVEHERLALCGARITGPPAPPAADRCVVCIDLAGTWT
jgi:hypothetical protein